MCKHCERAEKRRIKEGVWSGKMRKVMWRADREKVTVLKEHMRKLKAEEQQNT